MTGHVQREETPHLRSRHLLDELKIDADRLGLAFHLEPPAAILPDFIGSDRPDAMVITPDGGVIVAITDRKDLARRQSLADLAKRVAEQPGWSLRVFYANASDPAEHAGVSPTIADVTSGIDEARALDEMGHGRAALVMGWATLEAMARLAVSRSGDDLVRSLAPIQAVQVLVQQGYLGDDDARKLQHSARLRNEVVHGGVSTVIAPGDVSELLGTLESIASTLRQAA